MKGVHTIKRFSNENSGVVMGESPSASVKIRESVVNECITLLSTEAKVVIT